MRRLGSRAVAVCVMLPLLMPLGGCLGGGSSRSSQASSPDQLPGPEAAEACIVTAEALEAKGFYEKAILQYELARQYDPSVDLSDRLAVLYARQGLPTKAREEFEEALRRSPNDASLLNDVGYFHYSLQEWDEAESRFREALTYDPEHERAWTNLGLTLAQKGDWAGSYEASSNVMNAAEARMNIGSVLAQQGRYDDAEEVLMRALQMQPDLTQARNMLRWIREQRDSPGGQVQIPSGY